ncbi:PorV/PorQ family protein [Porphyromonas macacae]|uniref:PorV/PorQ family protein n=1 Tax=Porphyromonas macacae TaxID=28115 RepID=A0A379DLN6_9PORP|nr:PorV/PorQ family protein [Porphyromonas macacae]SUB78705.1 Uncharacterised protein [Porphyromonas macacae]
MNKNIIKSAFIAVVSLFATNTVAQTNSPFRILEQNADVRSQALGGTGLVVESNNYLYTNPAKLFGSDNKLAISAATQIMPKYEGYGREKYGALSIGYRLNCCHALFVGTRFLSGLSIPQEDVWGNNDSDDLKPSQTMLDLGYAYRLSSNWSAFGTASMLISTTGKRTTNYLFGLGVSYVNNTSLWKDEIPTKVEATLSAYNLGEDVDYGKGMSFRVPSTVALGLGARSLLNESHSLGIKAQVGYVTSYTTAQIGAGLEYAYNSFLALRTGYQHLDKDVDFYALGAGVTYKMLSFDVAYRIGLGSYTKNTVSLGLSLAL